MEQQGANQNNGGVELEDIPNVEDFDFQDPAILENHLVQEFLRDALRIAEAHTAEALQNFQAMQWRCL